MKKLALFVVLAAVMPFVALEWLDVEVRGDLGTDHLPVRREEVKR